MCWQYKFILAALGERQDKLQPTHLIASFLTRILFGDFERPNPMICRNGAQLAANCSNGKSVASRGFFDLFYQWSRGGCQAERSKVFAPESIDSH